MSKVSKQGMLEEIKIVILVFFHYHTIKRYFGKLRRAFLPYLVKAPLIKRNVLSHDNLLKPRDLYSEYISRNIANKVSNIPSRASLK